MRRLFFMFFAAAQIAGAEPIATVRWSAETSQARAQAVQAMQGASVRLQVQLLSYGQPVTLPNTATATFVYRDAAAADTAAWYTQRAEVSTNGVAAFVWGPEHDPGAASYRFFFRCSDGSDVDYSAYGALRMVPTPGFTPNVIEPPVAALDFATIEVSNAPWDVFAGEITAEAAARADADAELTEEIAAEAAARTAADAAIESSIAAETLARERAGYLTQTDADTGLWKSDARYVYESSEEWWNVKAAVATGAYMDGQAREIVTTYATKSERADGDSDTLVSAREYADAHADRTDNPHNVTAAQVGALTQVDADEGLLRNGQSYVYVDSGSGDFDGDGLWNIKVSAAGFADSSGIAFMADSDGNGRNIADTYATKSERADGDSDTLSAAKAYTDAEVSGKVDAVAVPSLIGHPYILQGATEVKAEDASVAGNSPEVSFADGVLTIIPQTTSPHFETNTVTISVPDGYYLYDIHGDVYRSTYHGLLPMSEPVYLKETRLSDNTIQLTASTPIEYGPPADGKFYCIISNFWASTYDRPMYQPHSLTNDTMTLPTFVDDYTEEDSREVVNARSLNRRIDERKNEIAAHTWARTPGGQRADEGMVHIDVPVLYSGQFSFLQAGAYACVSAEGGGFINSTDGSGVFSIGLSGRDDFQISAAERMLNITNVTWSASVAAIDVSTNGMVNAAQSPEIKYKLRLDNTGWLLCQEMQSTYISDSVNGDYWRCIVSLRGDSCFFSAWASQGANKITINQPLHLPGGQVVIGEDTYTPVTLSVGGKTYKVLAAEVE